MSAVETELTDVDAAAVASLSARLECSASVIGFHGHTVHHDPARGMTRQIGDAQRLAAACGVDVVADFRSADVAAGGQGAPLAPLYHAALAADLEKPLAVLNLGGVANVTWLDGEGDIRAFDTGPGNALLDDWAQRRIGEPLDRGGRLAAAGAADESRVEALMEDPYFAETPPKSLDRDRFFSPPPPPRALDGLSPTDGAATLVEFTAAAVAAACARLPRAPKRWLLCGGGRRNPALTEALRRRLDAPVAPVEAVGWEGDALEGPGVRLARRAQPSRPASQPPGHHRRRRALPRWADIPGPSARGGSASVRSRT